MDWRLKSLIRHGLLHLPAGEKAYRWLTASLLGTQAGMAYKWFRVFPAHYRVINEQFGDAARMQHCWCFDSGATMAAGLAIAIISDVPGLLTDHLQRLQDRYCAVSVQVLREKGAELASISSAGADRVSHLLERVKGLPAERGLRAINMTYAPTHRVVKSNEWLGRIGCVFSAGTLEHYSAEALEEEVACMAAALKSGGVMSHVVDHRDHRWHADKTISPLAHYALDDGEYHSRFSNPLEYHNRWLRGQYVDLFTRHGFRVSCRNRIEYTPDLPSLPAESLAEPFRHASTEELYHLVTHFVAIKQ